MIAVFEAAEPTTESFIRQAQAHLNASDLEIARRLDVSVGCLRKWDRRAALRPTRVGRPRRRA